MKIYFDGFLVKMGDQFSSFIHVEFNNYRDFVSKYNVEEYFMPDFINNKMNSALFFPDGEGWDQFITHAHLNSGTEIQIQLAEQPAGFNMEQYYPCNARMLDYLYFPERRMELFLYESRNHDAAVNFRDNLYFGLTDPDMNIKSLNSFKKLWESCNGNKRYSHFPTRWDSLLRRFSNAFPKFYNWIFLNYINENPKISSRFNNDFISHCNFEIQGDRLPF